MDLRCRHSDSAFHLSLIHRQKAAKPARESAFVAPPEPSLPPPESREAVKNTSFEGLSSLLQTQENNAHQEGKLIVERRKAERKQFTKPLNFRVSDMEQGPVNSGGQGVDISSLGLGMTSDHPLAQGMVLRVGLPVEDLGVTLPLFTEVEWVAAVSGSCRAGLRFLR